jgi:hypothetical protein
MWHITVANIWSLYLCANEQRPVNLYATVSRRRPGSPRQLPKGEAANERPGGGLGPSAIGHRPPRLVSRSHRLTSGEGRAISTEGQVPNSSFEDGDRPRFVPSAGAALWAAPFFERRHWPMVNSLLGGGGSPLAKSRSKLTLAIALGSSVKAIAATDTTARERPSPVCCLWKGPLRAGRPFFDGHGLGTSGTDALALYYQRRRPSEEAQL